MKILLATILATLIALPAMAANEEKGFAPCTAKVTDNATCDFRARGRVTRW